MNSRTRSAAHRIAELRERFIHHERVAPLEQRLRFLIDLRLADIDAKRCSEARGVVLSGEAGAGKSFAIEQLLHRTASYLGQSSQPDVTIISLQVPSPATLKSVGHAVLGALKYNVNGVRQAWYIWDTVRFQLRAQKVILLHFDEAQHLSSRGTKHELQAVTSMLKTLMTDRQWPVGLLLSGTSELENILNHDTQLSRRMMPVHFASMSYTHAPDVLSLIEGYSSRAGIAISDGVKRVSLAERLIHAANYQFGSIILIILDALWVAMQTGCEALTQQHFSEAYETRAACEDAFNPFIVTDYHKIDTSRVFTRAAE